MFDEEKKPEETSEEEEEPATEEPVEEEPVKEIPVEEVHHQKEDLGAVEEIKPESLPKEKPWWKFW